MVSDGLNRRLVTRSCVTVALLFGIMLLAWNFMQYGSGGLANDGVFHCRELQSSGSDDEASFLLLLGLILPALLRLSRLQSPLAWWERVAFLVPALAASTFIFLLPDCANWVATASATGDLNLIGILLLLPVCFVLYLFPNA